MRGRSVRVLAGLACILALSELARAQTPNPADLLARGRVVVFQVGPRAALPLFEQALPLFRARRDRRREAMTLGYLGYCYEELADYPKALTFLNQALTLKRQLGDRLEEGKTLNIFGLVYWGMGDYPHAVERLEQALCIAREVHGRRLEGAVLNNLGLISDEQGNYVHSLKLFHQALKVNHAAHFDRGEGDALGNLGGDAQLLGQYREALRYYEQARALDARRQLKPNLSEDLVNLGLCRLGLGQPDEALRNFDQSLALAQPIGLKKVEADAHKGKGTALLGLGKYDAARAEYRQAIEAYQQAGLKEQMIEALNDDGTLHAQLGDNDAAESDFRRAIEISRAIGHPRGVTTNLLALGDLEWRRRRYPQASSYLLEAYQRAREVGDQGSMASCLLQLALVLRDQGHLGEARPKAQKALGIARATGATPVEAQALYTLGELDRRGGREGKALTRYAEAMRLARAAGDTEVNWQAAYGQGQALEALKRYSQALAAYRRAVTVIESVRNRLREQRFQAGYLRDKYQVYVSLVHLLLKMGKTGEAFFYSEKLRAFSFRNIVHQGLSGPGFRGAEELHSQILQLQRLLDQEQSKGHSENSRQAAELVSSRLRLAERKYEALLDDWRGAHPQAAAWNGLLVAPASQVQEYLPARAALIDYILGNHALTIFVLTRHTVHATSVRVSKADLRAKIELFRDLVTSPRSRDWRLPAASLESLLITPLEKPGWLKGVTRLYLVPNGVLYYLPFAALPRPSPQRVHYLIEDYELAYLPAAMALVYRHPVPDPPGTLLAMAPAQAGLKYARQEVREVGDLYPKGSLVLDGTQATKQAFERHAGRFGIIHLAAHGFFDKFEPMFSGIQLQPDGADDGRLEVYEILRLRLQARLVTLSACETALGSGYVSQFPAGDDFVGLTRAFLSAGSSSVLASLWDVNDRTTSEFMDDFYRELRRSNEIEALRKAQVDFIHSGGRRAQPYYWAPFVLMGAKK